MEIIQSNLELACGYKLKIIRCNIIVIRFKQYVDKHSRNLLKDLKGIKLDSVIMKTMINVVI